MGLTRWLERRRRRSISPNVQDPAALHDPSLTLGQVSGASGVFSTPSGFVPGWKPISVGAGVAGGVLGVVRASMKSNTSTAAIVAHQYKASFASLQSATGDYLKDTRSGFENAYKETLETGTNIDTLTI